MADLTTEEIIEFSNFVCDHLRQFKAIPLSVTVGDRDMEYDEVWDLSYKMGFTQFLGGALK